MPNNYTAQNIERWQIYQKCIAVFRGMPIPLWHYMFGLESALEEFIFNQADEQTITNITELGIIGELLSVQNPKFLDAERCPEFICDQADEQTITKITELGIIGPTASGQIKVKVVDKAVAYVVSTAIKQQKELGLSIGEVLQSCQETCDQMTNLLNLVNLGKISLQEQPWLGIEKSTKTVSAMAKDVAEIDALEPAKSRGELVSALSRALSRVALPDPLSERAIMQHKMAQQNKDTISSFILFEMPERVAQELCSVHSEALRGLPSKSPRERLNIADNMLLLIMLSMIICDNGIYESDIAILGCGNMKIIMHNFNTYTEESQNINGFFSRLMNKKNPRAKITLDWLLDPLSMEQASQPCRHTQAIRAFEALRFSLQRIFTDNVSNYKVNMMGYGIDSASLSIPDAIDELSETHVSVLKRRESLYIPSLLVSMPQHNAILLAEQLLFVDMLHAICRSLNIRSEPAATPSSFHLNPPPQEEVVALLRDIIDHQRSKARQADSQLTDAQSISAGNELCSGQIL